jgi:hypothetical protein
MHQFKPTFFRLLMATSLMGPACNGSSHGGAASVPQEKALESLIKSICNGLGSCCASRGVAFDAARCDANLRNGGVEPDGTAFCPPPAVYDPQAMGDCLAAAQAAYASCSYFAVVTLPACQRMCVGSKPPGQPCGSSLECTDPADGLAVCGPASSGDSAGVCKHELRGKPGDSCQYVSVKAERGPCSWSVGASLPTDEVTTACYRGDGLDCQKDERTNLYTCQPLVAVAGSCGGYGNSMICASPSGLVAISPVCVDSAYCSDAGVCAARKPEGSPCSMDPECSSDKCDVKAGFCQPSGLDVTAEFCADPKM